MLGLYTPVLLLQAFCAYHAYRNNSETRWYWLILLFPGVRCAIYLFHHFYNRKSISNITETVKTVVNSNYKVEQLEKAHRFSDTLTNKLNLAEAYIDCGRYDDAIVLFKESLAGFMADDPAVRMKLLHAYYLNSQFPEAVELGILLNPVSSFKNSEQRLAYAWALHYSGKSTEAETVFKSMDKPNTNYVHRKELARFLCEFGKYEDAKAVIAEMTEEFEHMKGTERRFHRDIMQEVNKQHVKIQEHQSASDKK